MKPMQQFVRVESCCRLARKPIREAGLDEAFGLAILSSSGLQFVLTLKRV